MAVHGSTRTCVSQAHDKLLRSGPVLEQCSTKTADVVAHVSILASTTAKRPLFPRAVGIVSDPSKWRISMDAAKTPGITVDCDGCRVLDKEHRGVRIYARLGRVNQAEAERRPRPKSSVSTRKSRAGRIVLPASQMPRQGT